MRIRSDFAFVLVLFISSIFGIFLSSVFAKIISFLKIYIRSYILRDGFIFLILSEVKSLIV